MALASENVVVVYRAADSESLDFAEQYQSMHGLSADQLVAVPCSAIEVLEDYATFQSEVETPLRAAMASSPLSDYTIYAIVLMPRVPGGFYHDGDTVSATSRLSRIDHTFSKKLFNPLYNRQVFKRFDSDDAAFARICSRFDSPTGAITQEWFNNTKTAIRNIYATGDFFFDPYSAFHGPGAAKYEEELLFFFENLLTRLGLTVHTSFQVDPYVDPFISSVEGDSFFWGWGFERGSLSYFKTSSALRSFFYNGDFSGAETMRDVDARNWPQLAIRNGYVATAGSMSDPTIDGLLRPTPFFDALHRGATMGEAMLFSVPHLDWTIAFFGDPLLTVSFVDLFESTELVPFDRAWQSMVDCSSQSAINIYRKTILVQELRDYILEGSDPECAADFIKPVDLMSSVYNDTAWKNDYVGLVKALFNIAAIRNQTAFDRHFPTLADYLGETGNSVTDILLDTLQNESVRDSIAEEDIEAEGTWDFVFELEHDPGSFAFYHFELQVSSNEEFDDILLSKDSFLDLSGWFYEDSEGNYQPLESNGLTSNFAGRDVKYASQDGEGLERGLFYYFRIQQKDQLTTFEARDFRRVIYR